MQTLRQVFQDTFGSIERRFRRSGELAGISTGFKAIDEQIDGFQPELYVIGGRPSMGKSALLKDFIIAAAKSGRHCLYINIEDGNINTGKRMLSSLTGIDLWRIRKGLLAREHFDSLTDSISAFSQDDIDEYVLFDDTVSKADAIEESIKKADDMIGLNIVFIDYLQLIQGDNKKGQKRLEEIGNITRRLKELSKPVNMGIPFVVTAQLNRSVESREDKRPLMSDLRESGEIEQHADVIAFLYRDGYYKRNDDSQAEFIIAKGRNIDTGTIFLTFDKDKTTFRDYEATMYD